MTFKQLQKLGILITNTCLCSQLYGTYIKPKSFHYTLGVHRVGGGSEIEMEGGKWKIALAFACTHHYTH
jgi:hypothetical protein